VTESARILIIDDDPNVLGTFSTALRGEGYEVDIAADGRSAIEKSKANFYNLALIDIRLPDMEGTRLLTEMRETTPKMVKIIVTGYPSLQNAIESLNKGADGYIIKPAQTEELIKMLREHLREQQEEKRYSEQKIKEYVDTRIMQLETQKQSNPNQP